MLLSQIPTLGLALLELAGHLIPPHEPTYPLNLRVLSSTIFSYFGFQKFASGPLGRIKLVKPTYLQLQ